MIAMNIAFVSNEYPPNVRAGLGRYSERIVKYFLQDGHKLTVFASNSGDLPIYEGGEPLTVYRPIHRWIGGLLRSEWLNRWRTVEILLLALNVLLFSIDSFFLIRRLQKRAHFDVIAFHDTTSSPVGAILMGLLLPIPLVFHVHSTETTMTPYAVVKDPLKIIRWLERWLAHLATKIIVLSPEQVELLVGEGWESSKLICVPHGYDGPNLLATPVEQPAERCACLEQLRQHLHLASTDRLITFVGRLVTVKGVHTLIQAMPIVLQAVPNARLVLVGEGKGRGKDAKVANMIESLGVTEQVYAYHAFLDSKSVMQHMLLADLCVFPSIYEPFGLVAVEAMSLGKATVLGPGFSRLFLGDDPMRPMVAFVAQDSAVALAKTLIELLQHDELRDEMGARAKQFVAETFRWEVTVQKTIDVYQEAIRERNYATN